MDFDDFAPKVEKFRPNLRSQDESQLSGFYFVRPCYESLFELMLSLLRTYSHVTVVGTPGVGKSVFCQYLFKQLRSWPGYANKCFFTVSVSKDELLRDEALYLPYQTRTTKEDQVTLTASLSPTEALSPYGHTEEDIVYVYDGTPSRLPSNYCKLVHFASPSERHFERRVRFDAATVCLDTWSLEELLCASRALDLGLSNAVIEKRYDYFGGLPGMCLKTGDCNEEEQVAALQRAATSEDLWHRLVSAPFEFLYCDRMAQHMFHLRPSANPKLTCRYTFYYGSKYATELFFDQLCQAQGHKAAYLLQLFVSSEELHTLFPPLNEAIIVKILSRGGCFSAQHISKGRAVSHTSFSLEAGTITKCTEFHPTQRHLQFHDYAESYIHEGQTLYVFKSFVKSLGHPVTAFSILLLLKGLDLLTSFLHGKLTLKVVFVTLLKPHLLPDPCQLGMAPPKRVKHIWDIPGMKQRIVDRLADDGVFTMKKLRHHFEEGTCHSEVLGRYFKMMENEEALRLIARAPRFVLCLPRDTFLDGPKSGQGAL
jgi:hypothetical protein